MCPICIRTRLFSCTGKAKYVIHTLEKDGEVRNVRTTNTYNAHNDQPVRTLIASGQTSMTHSERSYDNLGRLSGLKRGTGAGTVSYTYNERDWVSQITAGGFSETLHYADGPGTACYNGDVSNMAWKVSGEPMKRGYKFCYDGLDRLADALYGEGDGLTQNAGRYTERVTDYSANGAIRRMQRYGRMTDGGYGLTDDLTVTLHGNQLKAVSDAAGTQVYNGSFDFKDGASALTEYSYSDGGALTMDANKGISCITYDESGHPMQVLFASGNLTEYSYDADGVKWSVAHHTAAPYLPVSSIGSPASGSYYMLSSHKTEYFGSFIREDGVVTKYLFDGGYCTFTEDGVPVAHYYTRDHLGNVRDVVDGDGTVEQVTHYYPFGGIFGDACTGDGVQKYKYNGKELDRTHGLDTYDYGARMYDAALPVWDRPDPLAHKYYHISPYAYCGNNPIVRIDRDGRIWDTVIDLGFIAYDIADAATQYLNTGSVSSTTRAALGADALAAVIPGVTGAGIAVRAGSKTAKVGTNVIKAGEKKTTKSLTHKESSELKRARFVVDSKGNTIDTNMTPRGSYKQPNGDRTDILQKKPHYNKMRKTNDGYSHTHPQVRNRDKNGIEHKCYSDDTHLPTYEEIKKHRE